MVEPTTNQTAPTPPKRRKRRRLTPLRGIIWGGVGALSVYGFLSGCDGLFYHPSDVQYFHPRDFGLQHEDVFFETSDGLRLHGWWLPSQKDARGTVLHFHGNAANVTNHVAAVAWLPPRGFNVLVWDYRGFGRSEGSVTRAGTVKDGHAALDYVLSRTDVDPQRVFLYGQSLGGAVGLVVAAERKELRAVVAEATFGDYRAIATLHARRRFRLPQPLAGWLAGRLISDGYDPIDTIDQLAPRPLLVIAASADDICYPELSAALYAAAPEPKEYLLVDGAAHYEAVQAGGRVVEDKIIATFERGGAAP